MLPFVRHTAAEKEQEDTLLSLAPPATISHYFQLLNYSQHIVITVFMLFFS